MNKTRLSEVNFIRKSWSTSFKNGIVYKRVGFKCICTTIFRQYTELFYQLFTRATESGKSMGGCNFRSILPINVPKCYAGKIYVFWQETFQIFKILLSDFVEAMNTLIQERHNHSEDCVTVEVSRRTQKIEISLAIEGSGLAFFSTDLGHSIGSNVGCEFGVMLRGRGPHKPEFCYNIVTIHSLMIYTNLI